MNETLVCSLLVGLSLRNKNVNNKRLLSSFSKIRIRAQEKENTKIKQEYIWEEK
jgi:hypothetical protein